MVVGIFVLFANAYSTRCGEAIPKRGGCEFSSGSRIEDAIRQRGSIKPTR